MLKIQAGRDKKRSMRDWIDEEFERLRQKRDQAKQRAEVFGRLVHRKWNDIAQAIVRDATKLDVKLAELAQASPAKLITVTTDEDVIVVEKQSGPSYRVSLRLEAPARSIRIERKVVIGPSNEKRDVTERLALELSEAADEIHIEHPQQGRMAVDELSKYALLPIVTTLEKVLSRQ